MAVEVKKWRDVRQNTPSAAIVMDACSVLQRVRNPKARTDPLLGRTIRHISDLSADVSRLMAFFAFSHVPSSHQLAPLLDIVDTEARLAALTVGQLPLAWHKDAARIAIKEASLSATWAPDKTLRSLFRSEARIITRARCGFIPQLGVANLIHGRARNCALCGQTDGSPRTYVFGMR